MLSAELTDFDILAFSETWLHPDIHTNDILIPEFKPPERKDRQRDRHGGVMLYVKDTLFYKRRQDLEPLNTECIWIEIHLNQNRILFGLFYRPPNSDAAYLSRIEDSISIALDTQIRNVIVTGDFNLNMLNDQSSRKINAICEQFALYQTITEPTHFTENSSSLIDIILTSDKENLICSGVTDPFLNQETRYHCPVYGIVKFTKHKRKSFSRCIWKYDQGDYDSLRTKVANTDWDALADPDINTYTRNITNHINSLTAECVPNRTVRIRPSDPPWITTSIRKQIRKRKRVYKKATQRNTLYLWDKFKKLRNKVVKSIRESKQQYIDRLSNKLKSESLSSKDWWSTLKSFITPSQNSSVPTLEKDGTIYSDETEKANILNNFFRDQTLLNDQNSRVPIIACYVNSLLSSLNITPLEVESVLKSLPLGKAVGFDDINNRILREIAQELSFPLCSLINHSLRLGIFPDTWKDALVCPIFKGGDQAAVTNYRPISLLSCLEKVPERIIFKHLYNHLHDNSVLTPLQSGFIPGDSTTNQLTFLYNTFCQALDSGKEIRVVFCDVSKAFDRVWHKGLLCKLKAAGISGSLLSWFDSYLSNRRQRVILPGTQSAWNYIHAGVPQGSILGPLLFLLYINDIVKDIQSNIRLFADDTSLFIIVEKPETAAQILNSDLGKITNWAQDWLVSFNPIKTETLLVSRKLIKTAHPPLYMLNKQISEVESHKHLGLHFSNDGSWHKHITYIKEKAWTRIYTMRKLKFQLDRKSLETIYTVFIRPILEYGNEIWDNCTQYEKDELEKIQIEAARIATGTTKLVSIENLYSEIGWETLETRRNKQKLTLFYKMINHLTPLYLSTLIPSTISESTRYALRNANDIRTINTRTNQYYNSFLPSTIREWNTLPEEQRNSTTLLAFKAQINNNSTSTPKHYYFGDRQSQILHTRLRTKCSCLNYDIYLRNLIESPLCACGDIETPEHYFLQCRRYHLQRTEMLNNLLHICHVSIDVLLFGDAFLSNDVNGRIFSHVQKFIRDSKRFK
ncbi:MAG: reverse transcriptase domain-containing protein [Candidatus Thiodiazotropha taylori]|nr:reverse transcriptase domain-containing protein [Candidatus Thiodiazotropha taylori]